MPVIDGLYTIDDPYLPISHFSVSSLLSAGMLRSRISSLHFCSVDTCLLFFSFCTAAKRPLIVASMKRYIAAEAD